MNKFIVGAVAAVVIGLGFTAADASAHWENRLTQRWDPCLGTYVLTWQPVWVPDAVIVSCPPPVVIRPILVHRGHDRDHGHREHHGRR
jgi:hypothetical protein